MVDRSAPCAPWETKAARSSARRVGDLRDQRRVARDRVLASVRFAGGYVPAIARRREPQQITAFSDSAVQPSVSPGRADAHVRPRFRQQPQYRRRGLREDAAERRTFTADPRWSPEDDPGLFAPTALALPIPLSRVNSPGTHGLCRCSADSREPGCRMRADFAGSTRHICCSPRSNPEYIWRSSRRPRAGLNHGMSMFRNPAAAWRIGLYLSPDGKSVLVTQMNSGGMVACRLIPFQGGDPRVVGPPTGNAHTPPGRQTDAGCISPSNATGGFQIWRQAFPDGSPEQLTFGPTEAEGLAVAPDGHSLYTSIGLSRRTVHVNVDGDDHAVSGEGDATLPMWGDGFPTSVFSSDGKKLFYLVRTGQTISGAFGGGELWSDRSRPWLERGLYCQVCSSRALTCRRMAELSCSQPPMRDRQIAHLDVAARSAFLSEAARSRRSARPGVRGPRTMFTFGRREVPSSICSA